MKRIDAFKTRDGSVFESEDAARKYTERLYSDKLCQISHQLAQLVKYVNIIEYVDAHVDDFVELAALRKDRELHDTKED